MSQWTKEELAVIAKDENLYLSIPNSDGTMHKPAWIWVVQAEDELYCRGYFGRNARWYQSAKREGHGHLSVGGVEKEVRFEFPTDEITNNNVDEGYRQKYAGSPYLTPMIGTAREATVRLIPKNE
jgi:hypothetical protein